jgi:hypothetical protein
MRKPRPYQYETAYLASKQNLYIAFQCGLGKTLTAIEAVKRYKLTPQCTDRSVLVVVSPKVALEQWKREIEIQDPGVPVFLVTAERPYEAAFTPPECYVVTYYEALLDQEIYGTSLAGRQWGVIVADEAHKVKNKDARRTRALWKLHAHRRIAMSGTPFDKSPAELWSILHWFDKQRFSSFWQFVEKYIQQVPGYRATEFVGVKPEARDELATVLRSLMVMKTRKQVGQHVKKIVSVQRVMLEPKQLELYRTVRNADDVLVDIGTAEPLLIANEPTMMTRLAQLAAWPGLLGRHDVPSAKFDWVLEYIINNPQEPMLLFTRFRESAIELHRRIEKVLERDAGLVIGGDEPVRLERVLSGDVKYLVGTIAAVGTALDLPMLSTAVFVEFEWSSVLMRQAADRIHRMTTTVPPNIVFLVALKTIDGLMLRKFTKKLSDQQTFELMLARPGDEYGDDDDAAVAEALE